MTPYPDARILVVDDVEPNVRLVEGLLAREGYQHVRHVVDSREALAAFTEFEPDLVLLDLLMPHVDGYQLLGEFRDAMRAWPVPGQILIVTADLTARGRCWALGEGNFLPKPIEDFPDFWGRVATLLEIRMLRLRLHGLRAPRA